MSDYIPDLEKAITYIEENLKNSIAVEKVASFVNFSYYHFHRLFFSLTGETLGDYIRKRRLSEAAAELICIEKKIIDIALDYNFESQEAFTRSFKNVFGMTPAAFRKKGVNPIINQKDTLLGMDVRIIKSGYYAVFRHEGSIDCLRETYKYIWTTWLCNSDYSIDLRDDFELYKEDFLGPYNHSSIIWIYRETIRKLNLYMFQNGSFKPLWCMYKLIVEVVSLYIPVKTK